MNIFPIRRLGGAHTCRIALGISMFLLAPTPALAGMPVILLNEMARMRIQTISFFLFGFLVSSKLIQWVWNGLSKDFAVLPRLSYAKALGVVTLWGLLFVLVLTMIAGAREFMTPGAWEREGKTYRLSEPPKSTQQPTEESVEIARYTKLESLRMALWDYADTHQGRFPDDRYPRDIPDEKWQLPDVSGLRYLYVGGLKSGLPSRPLAYEPEFYENGRMVLFTDGRVQLLKNGELDRSLRAEKP
jgi:hypothetical protein